MIATVMSTIQKARSRTREREEESKLEPRRRQIGRGRSDTNAEDEYMEAHGGLDSPPQSVPPAPRAKEFEPSPVNDAQNPRTAEGARKAAVQLRKDPSIHYRSKNNERGKAHAPPVDADGRGANGKQLAHGDKRRLGFPNAVYRRTNEMGTSTCVTHFPKLQTRSTRRRAL